MHGQKILLTGSTGMLGSRILNELMRVPNIYVYCIGRTTTQNLRNFIQCDISNLAEFERAIDGLRPDVVIHCAANVNVNSCETLRDYTYALHVGTSAVIASKSFIKQTIYISTDSVFDGKKGDYRPGDAKNPLNYYALTKSQGEDELLKSGNAIVIRTNIIGYSKPLKNSLLEWALTSLEKGESISGFSNIRFNPMYVKTLAEVIVSTFVAKEAISGIYHFGSSDFYSKYEFLKLLARIFSFRESLIRPVEAVAIQGIDRPLNTTLNTDETQRKLSIQFPTLEREMLSIFADIKNDYV